MLMLHLSPPVEARENCLAANVEPVLHRGYCVPAHIALLQHEVWPVAWGSSRQEVAHTHTCAPVQQM